MARTKGVLIEVRVPDEVRVKGGVENEVRVVHYLVISVPYFCPYALASQISNRTSLPLMMLPSVVASLQSADFSVCYRIVARRDHSFIRYTSS